MVSGAGLKAVAVAGVLSAAVGGAVIARADDPSGTAAQAGGGLAISTTTGSADSTLMVDRVAQAGAADKLKVANNTSKPLVVTVAARPWTQSASGVASPNRRAKLSGVTVNEGQFTLAAGASKDLTVTLDAVPPAGFLYGALEVVCLPSDLDKSKGVVAGYRLVNSLRYNAATATYGLKAGAVKVLRTGSKQTLALSVRNTGNTIAPVTGSVKLKGALGTKNGALKSTRILPGKSVAVGLASLSSLRAGRYTATVTLIQNKRKTTLTKQIRVR